MRGPRRRNPAARVFLGISVHPDHSFSVRPSDPRSSPTEGGLNFEGEKKLDGTVSRLIEIHHLLGFGIVMVDFGNDSA